MNPFVCSQPPVILGQVGGASEAHMSEDGKLVELRYRHHHQHVKEVTYLRLLEEYQGVMTLYYANVIPLDITNYTPVIVVDKLNELPIINFSNLALYTLGDQILKLFKVWYYYNIANSHFFVNELNDVIYLTDIRLWEWRNHSNNHMLKDGLLNMLYHLRIRQTNFNKELNILKQYINSIVEVKIETYDDIQKILYDIFSK